MDIIFNGLFMGDTVKTTVRWVSREAKTQFPGHFISVDEDFLESISGIPSDHPMVELDAVGENHGE